MAYKIKSEAEYHQVMEKVESYLQKATLIGGFQHFSPEERNELQRLSLLAETWEDAVPLMPIRQPETLVEMIELKMYERKLKQKDMAHLLGISTTRMSEVMQGKRKINLDLAKRLYKLLDIDARFILEMA